MQYNDEMKNSNKNVMALEIDIAKMRHQLKVLFEKEREGHNFADKIKALTNKIEELQSAIDKRKND